jgi:hypothetical protein
MRENTYVPQEIAMVENYSGELGHGIYLKSKRHVRDDERSEGILPWAVNGLNRFQHFNFTE